MRFRSQTEKHELSHLYEAKIKNMGNAGRNGGEYYTPRPLIRANDDDLAEFVKLQMTFCEGDVVLAMDRPWVKAGLKHATIAADDLPCLLVQRTARLRGGSNLETHFLKLLIGSSAFTNHILGVQTGIGVPHISGQQIKDFEFARPPVAEQKRIAENLESLREEIQRLASLYERKLAALEALKKSLLHQAFTGEL